MLLSLGENASGDGKKVVVGGLHACLRLNTNNGGKELMPRLDGMALLSAIQIAACGLQREYPCKDSGHTASHQIRLSVCLLEERCLEYQYQHLLLQRLLQALLYSLDALFQLMADKTEAESKIIAILYAVWNNRIILVQPVDENALIADFYAWSERKRRYDEGELGDITAYAAARHCAGWIWKGAKESTREEAIILKPNQVYEN